MSSLLTRMRNDAGQALVFVALMLTALVGMAAVVVDVGSWYQADRRLQTAADAAALAGAHELPLNPGLAKTTAEQYAQLNYPGMPTPIVTFSDAGTIDVVAEADTPGIFAPVLNDKFEVVTVKAVAQARVLAPEQMKNVAPIAIHKDFACIVTDPLCFEDPVTIDFGDDEDLDPTSSKFGLLDLYFDRPSGKAGAGDIKGWIVNGYEDALPVNTDYLPANGFKHGIETQLTDAASEKRVLFVPIFDTASASTGYHVVGWAAFVIDTVLQPWKKDNHRLEGHFINYIATDLAVGNTIPDPNSDFGVHVITLTK